MRVQNDLDRFHQVNDLESKGYRTLGVARTDARGKWEFLHLPRPVVQSLIFLKLLVAGHLTICMERGSTTIESTFDWREFGAQPKPSEARIYIYKYISSLHGWLCKKSPSRCHWA